MVIQVQEAVRTPNRKYHKRTSPGHIIVKMSGIQNKKRVLKAARKRHQLIYKGKTIIITVDFSTETLKARMAWNNVFPVLKENTCT
jgi:hypothetical protein